MLLVEQLLMCTGLLPPAPDADGGRERWKTDLRAATGLLVEMRQELMDFLDSTKPKRLRICPSRKSYFQRLTAEPVYDLWEPLLIKELGAEAADAYQAAHRQARSYLLSRRPAMTIKTVMGPLSLPLDAISEGRWALEVDVVEGQRLLHDLASGALLKEEVDVFTTCFPETYAYLQGELDVELPKRYPVDARGNISKQPPGFVATGLMTFEGEAFGSKVDLTKAKPAPVEEAKPAGKSKVLGSIAKAMETTGHELK